MVVAPTALDGLDERKFEEPLSVDFNRAKPVHQHALSRPHGEETMAAWKKWQCYFCGMIYDEELGLPGEGIPPRTRWEDIPEDWVCVECGSSKSDFAMMELEGVP